MIKTCTLALSAIAAIATMTEALPCNMGEIQGKLLANATEGLKNCATTTGVDIWAVSDFPSADQAQKIMKTRDCVAFINQINERANQEIQCDFQVGGVEKDFSMFLVSLLTGQTGNETVASASGSDEVETPDSSLEDDEDITENATVKPLITSSSDGSSFAPSVNKTKASNSTSAAIKASDAPVVGVRRVLSAALLAVVGLALQL